MVVLEYSRVILFWMVVIHCTTLSCGSIVLDVGMVSL